MGWAYHSPGWVALIPGSPIATRSSISFKDIMRTIALFGLTPTFCMNLSALRMCQYAAVDRPERKTLNRMLRVRIATKTLWALKNSNTRLTPADGRKNTSSSSPSVVPNISPMNSDNIVRSVVGTFWSCMYPVLVFWCSRVPPIFPYILIARWMSAPRPRTLTWSSTSLITLFAVSSSSLFAARLTKAIH